MLVEEEYLAEDLGWDATGGREGVAAGADLAQCATDGGHLCIDKVKRSGVCECGGWDLLEDVVDKGDACLDGIGPVLGGSGARNASGRDKSFEAGLEGLVDLNWNKLTLHYSVSWMGRSFRGNQRLRDGQPETETEYCSRCLGVGRAGNACRPGLTDRGIKLK